MTATSPGCFYVAADMMNFTWMADISNLPKAITGKPTPQSKSCLQESSGLRSTINNAVILIFGQAVLFECHWNLNFSFCSKFQKLYLIHIVNTY